jgi:hypothetical protein
MSEIWRKIRHGIAKNQRFSCVFAVDALRQDGYAFFGQRIVQRDLQMKLKAWFLVPALLVLSQGCSKSQAPLQRLQENDPPPANAMSVTPANASDCPTGGIEVTEFTDLNGNGALDSGEPVITREKVCNGATGATGATGAQGTGAGIQVTQATELQCPAGGVVLTAYEDADNDGALEAGDTVTSTSTVCNGVSGSDGKSAYLTVAQASPQQCPAGGFIYTASSPGDAPVVSVVCDGQTGAPSEFEAGPVGEPVPGKRYTACHHDYLYIPGDTRSTGWLLFRHQGNGTLDQGVGGTGFQVWTVDISDFLLVSEVGGVTYCSLHWDPTGRTLTYTVVDPSDGLSGTTGTLIL